MLAGGGYAGYRWWSGGSQPGTQEAEKEVVTTKVTRGPLRQIAQCTGPIYSNLDVDIKCRASGEVISCSTGTSARALGVSR